VLRTGLSPRSHPAKSSGLATNQNSLSSQQGLTPQLDPLPGPPFGSLAGITIAFTPVPEPSSLVLAILAGSGLAFVARRRRTVSAGAEAF